MLKVRELSKSFGKTKVLSQFSIELNSQDCIGLLGPSGCGKTTALRILAGLESADSGSVEFDGLEWNRGSQILTPPEKRGIGFVFQNYALWPHLSVQEHFEFPLKMQKKTDPAQVRRMLSLLQIEDLKNRLPNELSGGQQQRVALGRALVASPKLVLFDEPLSNLDASLRGQVRSEINKLRRELGFAALVVSHDWEDVAELCDQVAVMQGGEIQQLARPRDLLENPNSSFVRAMTRQSDR
jgi:ABC-type Fe3+/spermidine/putrescine transport system ATPase subunit